MKKTDGYSNPSRGYCGDFGGQFVPEMIMPAMQQLESEYDYARQDSSFQEQYESYLREYDGRPTPLTFAARLTEAWGGAKVYLKREDLNHTGAHKINNTVGQILLARRMGKKRIIAETGAGQHGVATATTHDSATTDRSAAEGRSRGRPPVLRRALWRASLRGGGRLPSFDKARMRESNRADERRAGLSKRRPGLHGKSLGNCGDWMHNCR